MISKRLFYCFCFSLAVSLPFWGCAQFREGNLPPISSWPPESRAEKKSISIIVSGEAIVNGVEHEANSNMVEKWRAQTVKAYRDSALFSEVHAGFKESDLQAQVKIVDQGEFSIGMAILTGLTLYLIPNSATDEVIVKTTFKDHEGKTLGSFTKSEALTFWQQLFLIFAMPFHSPATVTEETLYDLSRATIIEANSQDFISN